MGGEPPFSPTHGKRTKVSASPKDDRPVGVLLLNLGSPDAPTSAAVRRYLRQFLSDPRVLDFPAAIRRVLLETIILPIRSSKSAKLYQNIWDPTTGSPLLHFSAELRHKVAGELGENFVVRHAMRYGSPSIAQAWSELRAAGVRHVIVMPLYPQETSSTIGSALDELRKVQANDWVPTPVSVIPAFYTDEGFLATLTEVTAETLAAHDVEHVLFSFHSIPQRHITKGDATGTHCFVADQCCSDLTSNVAAGCYRAQCLRTAQAVAQRLELPSWSVSFQSRLGRIPWVEPYTDLELARLAQSGIRRIAVTCPAFVADNLETVEEIDIRGRAQWAAAGGEELVLVPGLNDRPSWVQAVVALVRSHHVPA